MLILALNTIDAACDVALVRDGAAILDRREDMPRGADARLPGLVTECFSAAGCQLSDLDRIAVVTGPGSFTGIRIGVAFARGLALSLNIPALGLTSLEAGTSPDTDGALRLALPAQKRPPDRTWWIQDLQSGLGAGPVHEVAEAQFDLADTRLATPRAVWAGLKAGGLLPKNHPPSPAYARAPEIHTPKRKP